MRLKKFTILFFFVLLPFDVVLGAIDVAYYPVETNINLEIVAHQDYALGYWETNEIPAWVVEQLTPAMLVPICERDSSFRKDPKVSTGSALSSDYTNSGFDRGHMAPAADFTYDGNAMYESFYMSNVCPQHPNLNRGVWAGLEDWVRDVAKREGEIVVVTGPIVTGTVERIGKNGVAVPHGFFKALYDTSPPCKMIGFLYANSSDEDKSLSVHAVSIDEIERRTGLDLYPNVPEDEQRALESVVEFERWIAPDPSQIGFIMVLE